LLALVFSPNKDKELAAKKRFKENCALHEKSIKGNEEEHEHKKWELDKMREKVEKLRKIPKMKELLESLERNVRKTFKNQQQQIRQDRVNGVAELALDLLRKSKQEAEEEAKERKIAERQAGGAGGVGRMLYGGLPCPTQFLAEEANFVAHLRHIASRALDSNDLKALLNMMGGHVITTRDLRAELHNNVDIAAIVKDAEDVELPAYVIKYRKMLLLRQGKQVKRELRKARPPVSLKTKKGLPARPRKLIQRVAKLRRKECMKFRKEFERFRSLVELHRKEHAEEGFGRVESIRSAVANIQRLSRPPERAQLQTMVADLYKNKRAKLRNKRLDLWEDMKKSASSRADPSPLEATQFAAITIESTTEELLSMEMRARAWYASKSRFLAVAQRQDDDSAGRDDNEEGDGSFLTSITAGLDSIHDLLLGDSDDEKDKNSQ
jgi:hypothetical protein